MSIDEKLASVRLIGFDFDGIFTDGTVVVSETGEESVRCSRKDGLGIDMLRAAGISMVVISKEKNPVVAARCRKLSLPCIHGVEDGEDKRAILERVALDAGVGAEKVCFMGDDVNDLEALDFAGVAVTVADAHALVREACDIVCRARGGQHAIREFAERLLQAQGRPLVYSLQQKRSAV
jgi:YrbI family 3-deoxy-D-manno-octulosonate 8-phosphate phosphatase